MTCLRCPVCKTDLLVEAKRYVCANNHSFDIARQGYVNLLLGSQMASKHPGDSAQMLADRREFLEAGFYAPLRQRIVDLLAQLQANRTSTQTVLDLGCGDGYYTAAFTAPQRQLFGLDIAKPALAMAAKRSRETTWCVSTSRALPFHDDSLDVVTNIFCRPHPAEIQRTLRGDGSLVIVGPGANHLRELREILYETVNADVSENALPGFTLAECETLQYTFDIRSEKLMHLARMTPHYWRAPQSRRETLEGIEALTLHAEFVVQRFVKGN